MKISEALQKCADEAGLSNVQIAAAVGVAESTASKWRRGVVNPRHEYYLRLIKLFPDLPKLLEAVA